MLPATGSDESRSAALDQPTEVSSLVGDQFAETAGLSHRADAGGGEGPASAWAEPVAGARAPSV